MEERVDVWVDCDAVLRDGGLVHLAELGPADEAALRRLHAGLSEQSHYLRFFSSSHVGERRYVDRLARLDGARGAAIGAFVGGALVGVASYERVDPPGSVGPAVAPGAAGAAAAGPAAEVAFTVEDAQQGRGVGTLLLEHLAAHARGRGVTRFVASALAGNQRMLEVFGEAGFDVERRTEGGVVEVAFPIARTARLLDAADERERQADVRSLAALLRPASVVVVGASRSPHTVGHEVLRNLRAGGFTGRLAAVNPHADEVAGVPCHRSLRDVGGPVDLAVLAVPAAAAADAVVEAAGLGVRALVVLSAGFAEAGPAGAAAEHELVRLAREHGMRLVGPNCMGVLNTDPAVALNATFAPAPPRPGRVAFVSQSGGLGIALLEQARALGIGLSTFVSTGNKADVSGNDLLLWAEQDAGTDVVALYLESVGNPRTFSRVARRVGRRVPIVAVKGGGTAAGSRAAHSHTAAAASPAAQVEALFRQAGVIAVDGLGELLDTVGMLAHQPLPAGRRLAVVGNAGGPNVLAADAAAAFGLELAELGEATRARLRRLLPPGASVANPVDTIASVSGPAFERALRAVLADGGVDAVLAVIAPTPLTGRDDLALAVSAAGARAAGDGTAGGRAPVPLAAVLLGQAARVGVLAPGDASGDQVGPEAAVGPDAAAGPEAGAVGADAAAGQAPVAPVAARPVPTFSVPEDAIRAFARAAGHARWLRRPHGMVPAFDDVDRGRARAVVDRALGEAPGGGWLDPAGAADLLAAYGVPVVETRRAGSAAEAAEAAAAVLRHGATAVLKAGSGEIVHKTERGAVRLGIATPADASAAFERMAAELGDEMGGAVVQPMAPAGVETIVGVVQDRAFGPLVGFGLGGVFTDLLDDRVFRLVPLTDVDAAEMVRSLRASAILRGYRGRAPADVAAIEDVLLRVAQLADDIPEVAEMDVNPLLAHEKGVSALDVKVRLAPPADAADPTLRRLR
jgi:acyl-CoA synthetase (NDP forming)/GNAT superfamily N-acetyltransferase